VYDKRYIFNTFAVSGPLIIALKPHPVSTNLAIPRLEECRKSQADLKKATSAASLMEAELTTSISELEAAAQRAETLHAAKVKQLYQKIQTLEAEACSQESQQSKDANQVSALVHKADKAQKEADQLHAQLHKTETVRYSNEMLVLAETLLKSVFIGVTLTTPITLQKLISFMRLTSIVFHMIPSRVLGHLESNMQ
jgi:hypothetical protein